MKLCKKITLSDKTCFEVMVGDYGPYTRLVRSEGETKKRWLNIGRQSVEAMHRHFEDIEEAMTSELTNDWVLQKNLTVSVCEYKEHWYCCFHLVNESDRGTYHARINLTKDEWLCLRQSWTTVIRAMEEAAKPAVKKTARKRKYPVNREPKTKLPKTLPVYTWTSAQNQGRRRFYKHQDCERRRARGHPLHH